MGIKQFVLVLTSIAILGCTSTSKDVAAYDTPSPRNSTPSHAKPLPQAQPKANIIKTADYIDKWKEMVVALNVEMENEELLVSSGFFISPQILVSAYHSVEGDVAKITVIWDKKLKRENATAQIWKSDPENDIALLKLEQKSNLSTHFSLAKPEASLGLPVVILGFPEITQPDEELRYLHLFTGHVASVMPPYNDYPAQVVLDARIFGGNSGGPVVSLKTGEVVGVISQVVFDHEEEEHSLPSGTVDWRSVEGESMGVAIPTTPIFKLLENSLE